MDNNIELKQMISDIKRLQKKYIKSNYNLEVKKELDSLEKRLKEIPIYVVYLQNLEKVNEKIDYLEENLNNYFDKLLN